LKDLCRNNKEQKNQRVRTTAQRNGVKLWEIAQELKMNDGNFSRLLRTQLPPEVEQKILKIIEKLSTREGVTE